MGSSPRDAWFLMLGLLAPATLIMAMDRAVVTVTAPTLQTLFGLSLPQVGLIFAAFFWAYAALQVPAGAFVERVGPRIALFWAILLWSAMTAVTPFAGSFAGLLAARVMLGIGQSADWPASIVAINRLFDQRRRATANAVLLCALYAGPVIGAPIATHFLKTIGLPGLFVACGFAGFVFSAIWYILYRDPAVVPSAVDVRPRVPLRKIMLSARAWALAGSYACTASLGSFYLYLFPTYLARARGLDVDRLGSYSAISAGALCISALLSGPVLARIFVRSRSAAAARLPFAIGSLALVTVISAVAPLLESDQAILIAACACLAAIGVSQVTTWSVVQDVGRGDTGALTGLINLVGNLSAGAMPLAATMSVSQTGDWTVSFRILAIVAGLGCLLWLLVDPNRPVGSLPDPMSPSRNGDQIAATL